MKIKLYVLKCLEGLSMDLIKKFKFLMVLMSIGFFGNLFVIYFFFKGFSYV